jgi:hypothetical protein
MMHMMYLLVIVLSKHMRNRLSHEQRSCQSWMRRHRNLIYRRYFIYREMLHKGEYLFAVKPKCNLWDHATIWLMMRYLTICYDIIYRKRSLIARDDGE